MRISVRQLKQLIKEAIEEQQEGDFRETQSVDELLAALKSASSKQQAEEIKRRIFELLPKNLLLGR
jgi:vacuolar-type H+-ATPase subunit I/STV1